ncbi:MAG: apolipoprotein N-acyltransferase [Mycobacterium sp.]|nr:apolipoprotein N-acyltransferase [Mycobacterium sp.]
MGVTVAAGALFWASFPPVNWWWAAVPAFALLAWVLTHPETTLAGGAAYGLVFGLAFYVPLVPWAGAFAGMPPWLGLAMLGAAFTPFFGLTAVAVRRLPGWPVWFAVLWQVSEWLRSWVLFGGVPWGVVAAGQTSGPLLPLVRLGGSPLLSVAVVLIGCSLTAIARDLASRWRPSNDGSVGPRRGVALAGVYLCLVMGGAAAVWPVVRHAASAEEPSVTVAAVQGNVPRLGSAFNARRRAVLDNHVRETLRLADDVRAGRAPRPLFVVWPENSSDIDPLLNPDAGRQITRAVDAIGAPILVGALLWVPHSAVDNPAYTNTVIVWNPASGPGERHTKQFVQPFGEYMPLPWLFSRLSGHANRPGYIVPGRSTGVVHVAGVPVGVGTCWEVTFDRALRQSVHNSAQLLVVPANNATFGEMMSEQQLAFSKFRAVELDRYVVVASTTGISAVIAPDGHELARTGYFTPAYLDLSVRLETHLTPAARWGALVQWMVIAVGAAAVLAAAVRWRRSHTALPADSPHPQVSSAAAAQTAQGRTR